METKNMGQINVECESCTDPGFDRERHLIDYRCCDDSTIQNSNQSISNNVSEKENCLAIVDERIVFRQNDSGSFSAQLKIKNISPRGDAIFIKVKTTSPNNYWVRPILCIGTRNATAMVNITMLERVSVNTLPMDRFLVHVSSVPKSMMHSMESNADDTDDVSTSNSSCDNIQELRNLFATIVKSGSRIESYRVAVSVENDLNQMKQNFGTPSDDQLNSIRTNRKLNEMDSYRKELYDMDKRHLKDQILLLISSGVCILLFGVLIYQRWNDPANIIQNTNKSDSSDKCKNIERISNLWNLWGYI